MSLFDNLEPFCRFAAKSCSYCFAPNGVTFHWIDWHLRIWEDRGTFFAASTRRGSEPVVECYGTEELVWKWALTRIGAYTRYCMRYPAITPPLTNDALPAGVHLTGQGLKLDIAPGIPAFLNTDLDTLVTAYMSPTGGPLRDLTDFKTWETDPMGKGFFPNLETLVNWHKAGQGRPWLTDLCGFALNEHNTPVVTDYLFSDHPEDKEYLLYDGEKYYLERSSRGGPRVPQFRTPAFEIFARFLILRYGRWARSYLHHAPLEIPCQPDQIAPGWELVDDGLRPFGITTPDGILLLTAATPYSRVEFIRTAHLSLEELINAVLDPWGGMLAHYRDEEYWERAMRPRLSGMKPYSDYDLSSYDTFIASHPWYTTN
ncbi:hypothetical protein [Schaalia sp. Marseille-Q2122]|uniref:hypothetical protein n=1 Tax=Schaalia sp. Marseille-Q2122 TaxID=2736604 RepID=UPI00158F38F5|nr:hypothetical protein [Schaalia sp. Marseille-Q2122]